MKNLQNFGVQELSIKEIRETEGGGPIADFVHWLFHHTEFTNMPSGGYSGMGYY